MDDCDTSMSLSELIMALKEGKLLDDPRCTARTVTSFFVRVNASDAIYVPEGCCCAEGEVPPHAEDKGGGAANQAANELDFDEFCEIVCRICDAKVPAPREGPFENTLDAWLRLCFLPALRGAGKGLSLDVGVPQAPSGKQQVALTSRPALAPRRENLAAR